MATPKETINTALVGAVLATIGGVAVPDVDKQVIVQVKDYTDIPRYPKGRLAVEIFSGDDYSVAISEDITTTAATAPTAATLVPADNADDIAITADFVITFSETILAGAGNVVLHATSDDAVIETFPVATSDLVTIVDDEVTIALPAALTNNKEYYVLIDDDAFTGDIGNAFAGIAVTTTWSFTTVEA